MRQFIDARTACALAAAGAVTATAAGMAAAPAHGNDATAAQPAAVLRAFAAGRSPAFGPDTIFGRGVNHSATRRATDSASERAAREVRQMVAGGDRIATLPYTWGGGHGSFTSSGYDCSGSVSYVLHAAGLLSVPADSGGLESYGDPGPGRHVTIYANGSHAWMAIDGRRFDTIALQETGTRWSRTISSSSGYVVRHPHGL